MQKDNINEFKGGLHLDMSPNQQPPGTYRFALNAVNETELGDFAFISNEESNELCASLPEGFIPIGKVYMNKNEVILFLVSEDDTISEIGVLNDNCQYITYVNDEDSDEVDKLNFKVSNQIQATYRLRRGCERTVYFTDDLNRPRYYNLDSPEDFKNPDGTWAGRKFSLFKEYNSIPKFTSVEVLDSGGVLEPGSYNIAVQYVDEGLNPSEWMITSPTINIYNSLSSEDFLNINGSINSDADYLDFPTTTKSIRVELEDLDSNYPFYRLAFIEATAGTGQITAVKYTDTIPTSKNFFIYTGENIAEPGTTEEILFFNEVIERAAHIEQIENRLILANTQGKQVNYCNLQKYASRIKADVITKKIIANQVDDPSNTKNPTVHFGDMETGGTGYMPGEIYSFGIVYVFDDGSLSPVFHIPGKNPDLDPTTVFDPAPNTYPMSTNNESANNRYIDNDTCYTNDYWGLDSEGIPLQGKPVRHHRFPFRNDINVPLVQEETDMGAGENNFNYFAVQLTGSGELDSTGCTDEEIENGTCAILNTNFQVRVVYEVSGVEYELITNIIPNNNNSTIYIDNTSQLFTTDDIIIISIEEVDEDGNITDVSGGVTSPKNFIYSVEVIDTVISNESKIYSTEILGIKFSGVDMPTLEDTNGQRIIGYYIVRNERIDNERTILDTAVLLPVMSNDKYLSTGLLAPQLEDETKVVDNLFGFLHPEHKFNSKEYTNFDYIKQEGNFDIVKRNFSKTAFNDVYDGSSFSEDAHRGNDKDGFSFNAILRDNILLFTLKALFNILFSNIKQVFYLNALESRDVNDGANTAYNIGADNKIGMIQLEDGTFINPFASTGKTALPYVAVGRDILDSYSNFRTLPYYKESINMEEFDENTNQGKTNVFNGDVYTTPMRYTNTVFWDNRLTKRKNKSSALNFILGGLAILGGIALLAFGGSGLLVIGAGISIIGGGALFVNSGIERDALVKAYEEEYNKGLRETSLDDWVKAFYKYPNGPTAYPGNGQYAYFVDGTGSLQPAPIKTSAKKGWGNDGPSDDTIQWIGDTLTDLWFESTVNISLRHKMTSDAPTFLDAPGIIENGNNTPMDTWEFYGLYYVSDNTRIPISKQDKHIAKKLLAYDPEREDNRLYIGAPLGEWYEVNPDYHRVNREKIYYHLPLEYDCCTECMEDFPHRIHYSEQSFQEELSDNYRIFLPNNYRDIEGETGEITNLFKIGNNFFIHTLEGLWQLPKNYQERVTDQIVSFIGTGDYFSVPPQKVIDDSTGSSAGTQHKWSAIKTPNGYFFVSENQRKVYQFDGKGLRPISNLGLSNWFKEHTRLKVDEQYYNSTGNRYPYADNPSNLFGSGFISTYDTKKERIIFSKKDYTLSEEVVGTPDYELCVYNGQVIIFPNFSQIISDEQVDGWNYVGLENCRMKFRRDVITTKTETRQVRVEVPNTTHVYAFYDVSGSFNADQVNQLKQATVAWYQDFRPDDIGMTRLHQIDYNDERWVSKGTQAILDGAHTGDVLVMSFCNESGTTVYHGNDIIDPVTGQPTANYTTDYNAFVAAFPSVNSFIGITYPIATNYTAGGGYNQPKAFIQHTLLALKGTSYTTTEADALPVNAVFTAGEWTTVKTTLTAANPYSALGPGMSNYNWIGKVDRNDLDFGTTSTIISEEDFANDINALLADLVTYEEVETEVQVIETEFKYIDGTVVENPVQYQNSWTMSFSLKQDSWTSWHSYLPQFYINVPEKFYSWKHGLTGLYKHNVVGDYQRFYGELFPHILEYVSLSSPLITRIWNHIRLLTEAKRYDPTYSEYVDERYTTFNKMIVYNSRQCSGLLDLEVKDTDFNQQDFFSNQTINTNNGSVIIDRRERDWLVNDLRDIRINYNLPIWDSTISSVQSEYYIDKILNTLSLDYNKPWTDLESFRDKYLVVRLIFDNFVDEISNVKLITNYSGENEQPSFS